MDITETKQGFHKIESCHFFVIAKFPKDVIYKTSRRKLKHTVMLFEEMTGKPWEQLSAEGYMVMKVYAELVDRSFNVAEDYENWNRETWPREDFEA